MLSRHTILIVDDAEDDGDAETPLHDSVLELGHGGEVDGLMGDPVGVRAVAGQAKADPSIVIVPGGDSRAGGDGHVSADDGVCAEVTAGESCKALVTSTLFLVVILNLKDSVTCNGINRNN